MCFTYYAPGARRGRKGHLLRVSLLELACMESPSPTLTPFDPWAMSRAAFEYNTCEAVRSRDGVVDPLGEAKGGLVQSANAYSLSRNKPLTYRCHPWLRGEDVSSGGSPELGSLNPSNIRQHTKFQRRERKGHFFSSELSDTELIVWWLLHSQ